MKPRSVSCRDREVIPPESPVQSRGAELSDSGRILPQEALRPLARALIDLALQLLKEEQEADEERKAA